MTGGNLYELGVWAYRRRPVLTVFPRFCWFMYRACLAALAACALAGCAARTPPPQSSASLTVVSDSRELPAPSRGDLTAGDRPALIGPLDTIEVDVFGVSALSREMQVDASGRIAMPLIGTIDARGKTAGELAGDIAAALRGRYVRDPDVTINIKSSVSQVVTVDGQVTEPGLYPVTNQMTLMRVIASAKGLKVSPQSAVPWLHPAGWGAWVTTAG